MLEHVADSIRSMWFLPGVQHVGGQGTTVGCRRTPTPSPRALLPIASHVAFVPTPIVSRCRQKQPNPLDFREIPMWHVTCWTCDVSLANAHRSVEVFVVDTPRAANVALGAARADAESTHVLCRHLDESTPDFTRRVLRRIDRIQRSRRVRSLWYVVGSEAARARCSLPLLQSLLPMLESGSSLTVVGPGSHQSAVFEWIDSILRRQSNVTVRAQLSADSAEAAPAVSRETLSRETLSRETLMPRLPWFPLDAGARHAGSPGTQAA
jgi:hypothetical protein